MAAVGWLCLGRWGGRGRACHGGANVDANYTDTTAARQALIAAQFATVLEVVWRPSGNSSMPSSWRPGG